MHRTKIGHYLNCKQYQAARKMRHSNTQLRNISYDSERNRYRCEMRIGGKSRTARVKDLDTALKVRSEWESERDALATKRQIEKEKQREETPAFSIERPAGGVVVAFD